MKRLRLSLIAGTLVVIGLIFYLLSVYLPTTRDRTTRVRIQRGLSLQMISDALEEKEIIRSGLLFSIHATLTGNRAKLQSGAYAFPPSLSISDVVTILAEGSHQVELWVTIPEGATVRGIASLFRSNAALDSQRIVELSSDRSFIRTLGLETQSLEGYLMPDTYRIRLDDDEEDVLRMMAEEMKRFFARKFPRRKSTPRKVHETLTMASLVEGETRLDRERARVAGVYYNRLKRNMLLQADPTIQYIIPDGPRRVLFRDLEIDSPYNTYKYKGLPPGPVNNPGRASIEASLHPESHSFLYFVADGKGGHRFSRTGAEHQAAVAMYRKHQIRQQQ